MHHGDSSDLPEAPRLATPPLRGANADSPPDATSPLRVRSREHRTFLSESGLPCERVASCSEVFAVSDVEKAYRQWSASEEYRPVLILGDAADPQATRLVTTLQTADASLWACVVPAEDCSTLLHALFSVYMDRWECCSTLTVD